MERHEIYADGERVASVCVKSSIELCWIVAQIRKVIDGPDFELMPESELSEITSKLIWMR